MATHFVALLVTAMAALVAKSNGLCTFEYLSQPPTELSCNPYNSSSGYPRWHPITSCVLIRQYGTKRYDIQWFYKNSTHTETVSTGKIIFGDMTIAVLTSIKGASHNTSLSGYYWCQATIIDSNNEEIPLERSNILEVQEPEYYLRLPPCSNVLQGGSRCADLGSAQTTPTTESPMATSDDTVWKDATIATICIMIICILILGAVSLSVIVLHVVLKHKKAQKSKEHHTEEKGSILHCLKSSAKGKDNQNNNAVTTEPNFEESVTQSQRSYAYIEPPQRHQPPKSTTSDPYLQLMRDNKQSPKETKERPKVPKPSHIEKKIPMVPRVLVDGHYYTVTTGNTQEQPVYQDLIS